MEKLLQSWNGAVEINGTKYNSIQDATSVFKTLNSRSKIVLHASAQNAVQRIVSSDNSIQKTASAIEYLITVKKYMTRKATPEFDFMRKWNNDVPMPLMMMQGVVEKETRGMVYMKLHGTMYADVMHTCMKCGRPLTNPVSQFFGVGPECGGHNYVNPFSSDEELKAAVAAYRKKLVNITWEGWIIKSAITERKEIKND